MTGKHTLQDSKYLQIYKGTSACVPEFLRDSKHAKKGPITPSPFIKAPLVWEGWEKIKQWKYKSDYKCDMDNLKKKLSKVPGV